MDHFDSSAAPQGAQAIIDHIKGNRLDQAENLYEQLCVDRPEAKAQLIFPVMIAIQRGRAKEAWQLVNAYPEDQYPELRALCLKVMGDPLWYSYAAPLEDHPDRYIRAAMRHLLGRPIEEGTSA